MNTNTTDKEVKTVSRAQGAGSKRYCEDGSGLKLSLTNHEIESLCFRAGIDHYSCTLLLVQSFKCSLTEVEFLERCEKLEDHSYVPD